MSKADLHECVSCSSAEIGTVVDNSDCVSNYEQIFATEQEAKQKLEKLTQEANNVASEPCEITSSIGKQADGFRLKASFTFSCGAENLIYQLKLR